MSRRTTSGERRRNSHLNGRFIEFTQTDRKIITLGHDRPPFKIESSNQLIVFKPDGQCIRITARMHVPDFNLVFLILIADQFFEESDNAQYGYGAQRISPTKLREWKATFSCRT